MPSIVEKPHILSTETVPSLSLAELTPSYELATLILERARPLREIGAYRQQFYESMHVMRTPLCEMDNSNGSPIFVKNDTTQDSGAYKTRGAANALMSTSADTIVSFSTGNHGRSVAYAGARVGKYVELELPDDMSPAKREPLEALAANPENRLTLTFHPNFTAAQAAAYTKQQAGAEVIGPFGHLDVIAGQCSLGFEIVDDLIAQGLADKQVVIPVATAGGGHITGIALAVWQAKQEGLLGSGITVVGVQPENTDALGRAVAKVRAGQEPVDLFKPGELDTDCDALAIGEESLSLLTLSIVADPAFVSTFVTIDKLSLAYARRYTSHLLGIEVEPAAALPMAYAARESNGQQAFILPVTGKNISEETRNLYDDLVDRHKDHLLEQDQQAYRDTCAAYLARTATFDRAMSITGDLVRRQARDWSAWDADDVQPNSLPPFFEEQVSNPLSGATAPYRQGLITPIVRRPIE